MTRRPFPAVRLRRAGLSDAQVAAARAQWDTLDEPTRDALATYVTRNPDPVILNHYTGSTIPAPQTPDPYPQYLTQTKLQTVLPGLVGGNAPAALDTLKELADALGDDPNYAVTLAAAVAKKATRGELGPSLALVGTRPSGQRMLTTFAAGHGYTTNAGGTANLNDTTDFALGSQAVTVTTDGAGTAKTVKKVAQAAVDGTGKHAKVWIKVDAQAHVAALQLYLGDTNLANNWKWEMKNSASQPWMFDGSWTVWTLPWSLATVTGTPTRTAITDVQLRVQDDAAGPVTAHFGGVALVNGSAAYPTGVVSFTFDDTYLSQYTVARAKLDQYGFPGTAYVIQDYAGQPGRMTLAQLHNLERLSGWEVAGHATTGAVHNARITTLTDAQVQAEFAAIRDWLRTNGFAGDHYAYPGGEYLTAQAALAEQYFTSARTVYQRPETHPPARASKLRSAGYVTSTSTVASLTAAVDAAAASGSHLIITNHDLVTTIGSSTDQLIADFQAVVDYVATKGIPVRIVGEVLRTKP